MINESQIFPSFMLSRRVEADDQNRPHIDPTFQLDENKKPPEPFDSEGLSGSGEGFEPPTSGL